MSQPAHLRSAATAGEGFSGPCFPELNSGPSVLAPDPTGKVQGLVPLRPYEHVICYVQSFVMGATSKEMDCVERVLSEEMVKPAADERFWADKLTADVWCFVGR